MSLESILQKINELKPDAEKDVDSFPPETINGHRGRKNKAIEQIADLKTQYTQELLKNVIFIVATGSLKDEFTDWATNDRFQLFSSNPDFFYKDLAERVHPVLYQGKASPSNLFDVLGRHLEDKMNELGVNQYNQLVFKEKYINKCTNVEEFVSILKLAVNEQIGSEVVGLQAIYSIVDKAIASGYSGLVTPIVLPVEEESMVVALLEDLKRLTKQVYFVIAGKSTRTLRGLSYEHSFLLKEVNEDSMKFVLDEFLKSIKKTY